MEVHLVFINKDGTTQPFRLPSAVTFIGRRQDCDMCIPLSVVSRRHCEIYSEFDKVMVRDLKSRNGILVNDKSIDETQLKAGDVLSIGPLKFVIQIDGVPDDLSEFLPTPSEQPAEPQVAAPTEEETEEAQMIIPEQDETQEADFEQTMEELSDINAGQSQTMDLDDAFTNDFLSDDDLDLDSELG